MKFARQFTGELIGTFMMCFLGIGAVATATLFGALTGPGQVGLVWGIAIALGIYMTRNLSDAHFNPAVSIAMIFAGRMKLRDLPAYLIGQFAGAFLAAGALWILFGDSVAKNLSNNGLTMSTNSIGSAATIWCEVFPNTSNGTVSMITGAFAEGFGVFILCTVIFALTCGFNRGKVNSNLAPLFIGLTISVLICVVGPLTNAGFNPARDLGPRFVAMLVGWSSISFGNNILDTIIVYTVAPIIGGIVAALVYRFILRPMHKGSLVEVAENVANEGESEVAKVILAAEQ
ncbi:MAG: MIP/aquaporin family protein [Coriobacteriia bacterium]|nr:MIP/aquaporin family protein [Coriobacteriia bacterium]